MDIVLNPSEEIIERAKKKGYKLDDYFYLNGIRTCGVVIKEPFSTPVIYLGTIVFKRSKIDKGTYYKLGSTIYNGVYIREALSLLKARRVRVYIYMTDSTGYGPLLLGTTRGTVAFSPIAFGDDSRDYFSNKAILPMESIIKKITNRFKRGLVFAYTI